MSQPRTTSSTATCEEPGHSAEQDELAGLTLDELEAMVRQMLKLADETAAYLRKLESRCAGYRTVIQQLQGELATYRGPSEEEQLRHLLDGFGI